MLIDWSLGQISPEQHAAILDHLADCTGCRREVAAMVQAGALALPEVVEPPRRPLPLVKIAGTLVAVAAVVLAAEGSLTDYDYQLNGKSYVSPVPTLDQTTERIDGEFQQAVADHPRSVGLRLNYGQFLFTLHRWEAAEEQLAAARKLVETRTLAHPHDPEWLDEANGLARLGLGLIEFELGAAEAALDRQESAMAHFESALAHFEAAYTCSPSTILGC